MSERHLYSGTTVNFILGSKVVSSLFSEYIGELSGVNTKWTPDYSLSLSTRVDTIAGTYLGINVRDKLFASSKKLTDSLTGVKDDMVTVRKNIETDFKGSIEYETIINELGLKVPSVHKLTQPQMIAVLAQFKRGLTPENLAKITAGGMPEAIPQRLAESATIIVSLNNEQEKLKNSVKEASGTMITELNALYKEIIKICRLASDFYKKDKAKKSIFTFSTILKNLGDSKKPKETAKKSKEA